MKIPSWLNVIEVDNWIKQNTNLVWFWLYEIDKNIHNWILTYFSTNQNKVIDYNNYLTIYIIRSSYAKKPFNQIQVFLENINLYLDNNNPNINSIKAIITKLNPYDFSSTSKAWRIIRYLQQEIYQSHKKDISWMRSNKKKIILWENNWEGYINNSFWIIDNFFKETKTYKWKPRYNEQLVKEKLKELELFKALNEKFFLTEGKSGFNPNDNNSLYQNYISLLNSRASAIIEWYEISDLDSLTRIKINKNIKEKWWTSLQAVMNIHYCTHLINNDFNKHKKLNINFIHWIQKNIIKNTHQNNEKEEDKTPWYFRKFPIFVLWKQDKKIYPSKSWIKTNKAFIAPKHESINSLMKALIDFYNDSLHNSSIDRYILAWLLKLMFVIIHPYWDWNGRTSRLLFEWSLLNTWWIKNAAYFPFSYSVNENRKSYYEALQKTTTPTLYQIDCIENLFNNNISIIYENDYIFLNLDLTHFLIYLIELWKKCFLDAMFEYQYFKIKEKILKEIEQRFPNLKKNQKNIIETIVNWKMKDFQWGKKTNKKLSFLKENEKEDLKMIIIKNFQWMNDIEFFQVNEKEKEMLKQAMQKYHILL